MSAVKILTATICLIVFDGTVMKTSGMHRHYANNSMSVVNYRSLYDGPVTVSALIFSVIFVPFNETVGHKLKMEIN